MRDFWATRNTEIKGTLKWIAFFPLRKKCPYSEFFWSVFFRIWTEYGQILPIQSECGKIRTRKALNTDPILRFNCQLAGFANSKRREEPKWSKKWLSHEEKQATVLVDEPSTTAVDEEKVYFNNNSFSGKPIKCQSGHHIETSQLINWVVSIWGQHWHLMG